MKYVFGNPERSQKYSSHYTRVTADNGGEFYVTAAYVGGSGVWGTSALVVVPTPCCGYVYGLTEDKPCETCGEGYRTSLFHHAFSLTSVSGADRDILERDAELEIMGSDHLFMLLGLEGYDAVLAEHELVNALYEWIYDRSHPWIVDALNDEAELDEMLAEW